jgi:16S rRNA (adenine1518-N6/adenine1519-N6)-dimethyltransferase
MSSEVRPKKSLGQHFLHDKRIAMKIVDALIINRPMMPLLEIGPGKGILTGFLETMNLDLQLIEIDRHSVAYLEQNFPAMKGRIILGDFLEMDLSALFEGCSFSIIGNFPYNISSSIFFRVLENRDSVDQVVCMLQKEVADRIVAKHGSKTYGILSVLLQAYYSVTFLFKVSPGVFNPPPKVQSGVIRLVRKPKLPLGCDESLFVKVVKQAFNNRRKTLRNALKNLNLPPEISTQSLFDLRAEQLPVEQFVYLTELIEKGCGSDS